MQDVDAIVHTASPTNASPSAEPSALIDPAVNGTLNLLSSASRAGPSVRRIVLLSSVAAVLTVPQPGETARVRVFSETDWNTASVDAVRAKGRDAAALDKYCASKTLAERAAWEFVREHPEVGWDLVTLLPPYVLDSWLNEVQSPEGLSGSMQEWYEAVVKRTLDDKMLANSGACYVDVRDLALAHVLAVTKPAAGGERIIVSRSPFKWQDFVILAHKMRSSLPAGNLEYSPEDAVHFTQYAREKEEMLLGVAFRTMEATTKDILEHFEHKGWLL